MLPRGQLTKRAQERVRVEELREVELALQQGSVVGQALPVLDGVGPEIRIEGSFIDMLTVGVKLFWNLHYLISLNVCHI